MKDFGGRTAVVTGAANGIGLAIANALAAEGANVVVSDIDREAAERAAEGIRERGHPALAVAADVSVRDDVDRLRDAAMSTFGDVHILCNNAGIGGFRSGAMWEATEDDWRTTWGVNLFGAVNGIRSFLPAMLEHGGPGHVVNTASVVALTPASTLYGVAKHGVLALTEALDTQLRERGSVIGATVLCPGYTATRLFAGSDVGDGGREPDRARQAVLEAKGADPRSVAETLIDGIRRGRLYVLTDEEWDDRIRLRVEEILQR